MGNDVTTAVIVTGGASGIGLGSATALAEQGRNVALWDLNADRAAEAAAELASTHGIATIGLGVDVSDSANYPAAIEQSRDAVGPIGGLVHAAGTVLAQPVGSIERADWDFVLSINLTAFPMLVQALLADLTTNPGSAVVGISSIEGWIGNAAIPAYCASKAGMLGAVRSMAQALGPQGVRVNAVCPGYIETPMLAPALSIPGVADGFRGSSTLGRMGQPREIGEPVAFLLSSGGVVRHRPVTDRRRRHARRRLTPASHAACLVPRRGRPRDHGGRREGRRWDRPGRSTAGSASRPGSGPAGTRPSRCRDGRRR